MHDIKFIRCEVCGNLFGVIHDSGVKPVCCGRPMKELAANSTDAAGEKHVPVVERDGNRATVKVGSVTHPMQDEHFIQWIAVYQNGRMQRQQLTPDQAPQAEFTVADGPLVAYEYCNLHGLWKAEA